MGEDRILSLPNVVTTARLVLVPAFVWLLVQPHHRDWWDAAVLLAVLGSTDWVDGQLARRLDQVTNLGKVLDPLADRTLLVTAVIGILAVVFHFANGLWGVLFSWGVTVTRAAQRRSAYACAALGVALFLLGANTVLYFATGTRFYVPSELGGSGHAAACGSASGVGK